VYFLEQMIVRLKEHYRFGPRNEDAFFLVGQELIFWSIACIHKGVRFVIYCWPMLLIK